MVDTPKLDVTILGGEGSGKTTFLMGMFATLSAGLVSGFSLHCRNRDRGLDLLNYWDNFSEKGILPDPTSVDAPLYPFVFKSGVAPWLDFDVLDYRGAVTYTVNNDPDVELMLSHLRKSTSLYVVIDSRYLSQPVTPANRDRIQRATKLRQINSFLHTAIEQRQQAHEPLPSIVILLTKSDLLRDRFANHTEAVMVKELLQDLEQLVPLVFASGVSALVCPVRIGQLGSPEHPAVNADTWDPDQVDPKNLHRPAAFTLLHHIRIKALATQAQITVLENQRKAVQGESTELRNRLFGGFFRRDRLAVLDRTISTANTRIDSQRSALRITDKQIDQLVELLRNVPVLQDGVVTNMDLGDGGERVDDIYPS